MTRQLVGANLKMNLTSTQAREYFRALVPLLADVRDRDLFVLPPYSSLWVAREELSGTSIAWGAQDVHERLSGAHTGDVSAPMLSDLGCRYVEIGHSERRRDHHERDATIAGKVTAAIECGLEVVLCVGETRPMRARDARGVVLRHLVASLGALRGADLERVIVAYEPWWAIGAGAAPAAPDAISAMHRTVREWLVDRGSGAPRVVYGGSVDSATAGVLLRQPDVDGVFVGRAALDPAEFARIAHA